MLAHFLVYVHKSLLLPLFLIKNGKAVSKVHVINPLLACYIWVVLWHGFSCPTFMAFNVVMIRWIITEDEAATSVAYMP